MIGSRAEGVKSSKPTMMLDLSDRYINKERNPDDYWKFRRSLIIHEFGHALGLGHSDDPSDLMYPAFECQDVFGDYDVVISDYDIDGLDAIYPLHKPYTCKHPCKHNNNLLIFYKMAIFDVSSAEEKKNRDRKILRESKS